ncbi:uncharacterized protein [Procambarus clarkii]|uniref:uncharacterized protein n=1 Tax=Procambarus clarkii TaxID=6728 RepID=UPI003742EF22
MAGHLGVKKTLNKVQDHFYWPNVWKKVKKYCRTCLACQRAGKSAPAIPKAPLKPIPAFGEPFERVLIDGVGPLPRTRRGHEYLLTIMCTATRFPEAIPLRKVTSRAVLDRLQNYVAWVGMPKVIQTDQDQTVFQSKLFRETVKGWRVEQVRSSPYHPQSQGALERFHGTLKSLLRIYCAEKGSSWDKTLPSVLFAIRDGVVESLRFTPYQLVYGHYVRSPVGALKEQLTVDRPKVDVGQYVKTFRERLSRARALAKENLRTSQTEIVRYHDRKAKGRIFQGDQVLVLLQEKGSIYESRFCGPYTIQKALGDVNYVIHMPDRPRKSQVCHVNMIKRYYDKDKPLGEEEQMVTPLQETVLCVGNGKGMEEENCTLERADGAKISNTESLAKIGERLGHLKDDQRQELVEILRRNESLFTDVPRRHRGMVHEVNVGSADPIKQHPYRVYPEKAAAMRAEVKYLLDNDLAEVSNSDWGLPCLLVKKRDGTYRFCTDYRKVNAVTVADSFPIPRIDDCLDRIGSARYVSKIDLLKGYYQIPLSEEAKRISAFVTPNGLYQYKVVPFGKKNSGSCFQRVMNQEETTLTTMQVVNDPHGVARPVAGILLANQNHRASSVPSRDRELNIWYLDDGTFAVTSDTILEDVRKIQEQGAPLGLNLNVSNWEIVSRNPDITGQIKTVLPYIIVVEPSDCTLLGAL